VFLLKHLLNDVTLSDNSEVSGACVPLIEKLCIVPIDFWKIAKNKICVQQRLVTLTRFFYQDNLYNLIQNVYILKQKNTDTKFKKPQAGYNCWVLCHRSKRENI